MINKRGRDPEIGAARKFRVVVHMPRADGPDGRDDLLI